MTRQFHETEKTVLTFDFVTTPKSIIRTKKSTILLALHRWRTQIALPKSKKSFSPATCTINTRFPCWYVHCIPHCTSLLRPVSIWYFSCSALLCLATTVLNMSTKTTCSFSAVVTGVDINARSLHTPPFLYVSSIFFCTLCRARWRSRLDKQRDSSLFNACSSSSFLKYAREHCWVNLSQRRPWKWQAGQVWNMCRFCRYVGVGQILKLFFWWK